MCCGCGGGGEDCFTSHGRVGQCLPGQAQAGAGICACRKKAARATAANRIAPKITLHRRSGMLFLPLPWQVTRDLSGEPLPAPAQVYVPEFVVAAQNSEHRFADCPRRVRKLHPTLGRVQTTHGIATCVSAVGIDAHGRSSFPVMLCVADIRASSDRSTSVKTLIGDHNREKLCHGIVAVAGDGALEWRHSTVHTDTCDKVQEARPGRVPRRAQGSVEDSGSHPLEEIVPVVLRSTRRDCAGQIQLRGC